MNFLKTKKLLISITVLAIFASAVSFFIFKFNKGANIVCAGVGENVSGWAWNSNVGWVSFNTIDCDTNGNSAYDAGDTGSAGCPAVGTLFHDYGVNIDLATGNFSGYAWNSNVGWISFNRCGTDNNCGTSDGDTSNPPSNDPGVGAGPIAKLVGANIIGWAKILSIGDSGWIRFDHGQAGFEATADASVNGLKGWAWNGNADGTGIGWTSFNCGNYSSCVGGADAGEVCAVNADCANNNCGDTCLVSNYQVRVPLNNLPTLSFLSAPNWWRADACAGNARQAELKWTFNDADGDTLKSYQLKVYESGGPLIFNSGQCENGVCVSDCTGGVTGLPLGGACDVDCTGYVDTNICAYTIYQDTGSGLGYGTHYEWEVQVWDSQGGLSGMVSYNNNTGADTDGDPDVNSSTFTTFVSEFPNPDHFIWTPNSFSAEEDVLFESMDRAKYYTGNVEHDCDESNCSWDWTDVDNNIEPIVDASSTIMIFSAYGIPSKVELKVTDTTTSYSCSSTTDAFIIKQKLPSWIEAK
ncbi:hypothetical protein KAJ61_00660 [Candidatus Parcubacteria bacterium]|nr:hypothetical protein [Candidatus Parcubacteria bacterium]